MQTPQLHAFTGAMILIFLCASRTSMGQESAFENAVPELPAPPQAADAEEVDDSVEGILSRMSLREKVAQLMMVSMAGLHRPSVDDMAFIKECMPGGVLVQQLLSPAQALQYTLRLRRSQNTSGVPLLIGTDLQQAILRDRGAPTPFPQIPTPLSLAATGDPELARPYAEVLGAFLRALGFNLCVGPPLSLAPTVAHARGTLYSFGHDPQMAGDAAALITSTLLETGVLPMPMGFPGGAANHREKAPSVLMTSASQLPGSDLLPFKRALAAGAPMVHVGNILVPTLDNANRPASLSPDVMQRLLREELGFEGVIVAGPIDNPVLESAGDSAHTALEALQNGADMLLWSSAGNRPLRALEALVYAVELGQLSETRVDVSVSRILAMKKKFFSESIAPESEKEAEKMLKEKVLLGKVEAIERNSITIVKNDRALPLSKDTAMPMGVTGVVGVEMLHEALEEYVKPVSQQRITTAMQLGEIQDFEIDRLTSHVAGIHTIVAILTDDLRPNGIPALIRGLKGTGARVVVILLGYPRLLPYLQAADAIVLGYCEPSNADVTLQAICDLMMGQGPVSIMDADSALKVQAGEMRSYDAGEISHISGGHLPVDVPDAYRMGATVKLSARQSIKKVAWNFGNKDRKKEIAVQYSYAAPGLYPLTLEIVDKQGNTTTGMFEVDVRPKPESP